MPPIRVGSVMSLQMLVTAHGLCAGGYYLRGTGETNAASYQVIDEEPRCLIADRIRPGDGNASARDGENDSHWRCDRQGASLVTRWRRQLPPAGPSPIVKAARGSAIGGCH
jgi:hypothetical protein